MIFDTSSSETISVDGSLYLINDPATVTHDTDGEFKVCDVYVEDYGRVPVLFKNSVSVYSDIHRFAGFNFDPASPLTGYHVITTPFVGDVAEPYLVLDAG